MSRKRTDNSKSNRFRKRIIDKVIMILVILVLMISSFLIFLTKKQTKSIKYTEAGNVDYNISLNKNDFFESTTLPSSNQYIAELIDNIDISYKYNLQMKDNYSNYKYKYRIESQTKVVEKTTQNNIYDFSETLKSEETVKPDKSKFDLNTNITVNYAKYNEIVKKIISTYDLSNIESKTVITFYVDLLDEKDNIKNTSSMNVTIPLNVKTVNIETVNNIDNTEEKVFSGGQKVQIVSAFLVIAIILLVIEILKIRDVIEDLKRNFPKEVLDEIKLKRIKRSYRSYIQKVDNGFALNKYDMLKVGNFEDLLKIREIVQNPILMFENETKTKTYFIVTTATTIIYVYEINHGNVKEIAG